VDENTHVDGTNGAESDVSQSLSLYDRFNRLRALRSQLLAIKLEIRRLAGTEGLDEPLPQCECLRCGWTWQPYNPFIPPMTCSRCGTTAWNKPPTENSRKPSDPPSPRWRTPKRSRKKYFRVKLEGETWKRRTKLKVEPVGEEIRAVEAVREAFAGKPIVTVSVPPRISALLPPPPSPSLPGSLASRLAFLRGEQPEPQPETVSSHPAPIIVPTNEVQTNELDINVPTTEVQVADGTDIEREDDPSNER
jgi:hypothetical protein